MKFRFVIFSLLSLFCAQPVLGQFTEQEMANLLIQSFIEQQIRSSYVFENYSKEERAQRRADLVEQAESIRAQMYSVKQERLLKCFAWGFLGVAIVGSIALVGSNAYMKRKDCAHVELTAAKKLKKYVIDERLLTDLNAQWWTGFKIFTGSAFGSIAAVFPINYFDNKLNLQRQYKEKLEDIKKQIAELNAIEAANAAEASVVIEKN